MGFLNQTELDRALPIRARCCLPDSLTEKLRNALIKQAGRSLAHALAGAGFGAAGEFLAALEAASETAAWLYDKYPYIKAYLDPPRLLDELRRNVGKPEKGYEIHHIVEQAGAARDGFSQNQIDAPENLVRIPKLKHWEITAWYMKGNDDFGGLSPRAFLQEKSWEVKRRIGLDALVRVCPMTS